MNTTTLSNEQQTNLNDFATIGKIADLFETLCESMQKTPADLINESSAFIAAIVNKQMTGDRNKSKYQATEIDAPDFSKYNNVPDDENPKYAMQGFSTNVLVAIVNNVIDPVILAKREMANRGFNSNGEWIGFDAAAKHFGIKK